MVLALLIFYSNLFSLDPGLVIATAKVESSLDNTKIGPVGELGVLQLNPRSYPKFTKAELQDLHTNIVLGILHIKEVLRSCNQHDKVICMIAYNRGMSGYSKMTNYSNDTYYKKLKWEMEHGASQVR